MKRVGAPTSWTSPTDLDKKESDGRDPPQGVMRHAHRAVVGALELCRWLVADQPTWVPGHHTYSHAIVTKDSAKRHSTGCNKFSSYTFSRPDWKVVNLSQIYLEFLLPNIGPLSAPKTVKTENHDARAIMIFMRNFGRIIGLITEALLFRIRLF